MNTERAAENWFEIVPPDPPNNGIMFVDHSKVGRSGHLGHALVEYEPGRILAFYPNCSDSNKGHSGDGWMEFKRSEDGGATWSEPSILEYSKSVYDKGVDHSVMCEKAALTDDCIILFNLECRGKGWMPLEAPTCISSADGGYTWSSARPVSDQPGRIWDVITHEGEILVLELCNDSAIQWYGNRPEHHYALYVSADNGRSFSRRSVLPFDIQGRGYGTMEILPDSSLIAYVYNIDDEKHLDYVISCDTGRTWEQAGKSFMAKQIRNPQMAAFKKGYVLHGRSGNKGDDAETGHFVLYTSRDGIKWDAGRYLRMKDAGLGAYSNNLLVKGVDKNAPSRLLIQASHAYKDHMTNVLHWWLR